MQLTALQVKGTFAADARPSLRFVAVIRPASRLALAPLLAALIGSTAVAQQPSGDGCPGERDRETGQLPRPTSLFCDPFAGSGVRYPNGTGALGHRDVSTTMIYTYVLNRGGRGVRSPADALDLCASSDGVIGCFR